MTWVHQHRSSPDKTGIQAAPRRGGRRGLVWLLLGMVLASKGVRAAEETNAAPRLPLLTNAIQLEELPAEQARLHYPLRFRGVMTFVDPGANYGFVQDATAGAVAFWTNRTPPALAGQLVEVTGTSDSNVYAPVISAPVFKVLGPGEFPKPLRPTFADLNAGRGDCQWNEVEGLVRSATTNSDFLFLTITMQGHRLKVSVLTQSEPNPERWVEARVRMDGVGIGSFNGKGLFVGAELAVPSLDQITIVESSQSDPYSLPVTPVRSLGHKSEKPPGQRIHIQGVATLLMPGEGLFVRDQDNSIEVLTSQTGGVSPGDRVDVIGFYEREEGALVIEDGNFRRLGAGPPPKPVPATIEDIGTGRLDAELVTVTGRILEWRHGESERAISLQGAKKIIFTARVDGGGQREEFPVGSMVEVTGVCLARFDQNLEVRSFDVHLRSPADLVLVASPPWWTTRHIFWLVGALVVAGVFGLGWMRLLVRSNNRLERRVAERTEALERENAERRRADAELQESRALYLSLVENLPVGIYRKDREGRFVFGNPRFHQLQGLDPQQTLGRKFSELYPAEVAEASLRDDETVMRTREPLELNKEHRSTDGRIRQLHILKTPIFDAAGQVVGTQGMLTDVTERKRAESELAYERDLLRSLLDHSSDHIYFKDLNSRFIQCSKKLWERFGLGRMDEVIGKTDFDLFATEHAQPAYEDEQEIIRTGKPLIGKVEKEVEKDGRVSWVLTSKMLLRNKVGEVIGTFGISKDITAMKETEARLEQTHRQLLETSRMAGMAEVATSVLHNVGNVLNSVNVSSSMLADRLRKSRVASLGKAVSLIREHEQDLPGFFTGDPKGKKLPDYLQSLADHLVQEQVEMLGELASLHKNVEHINEIVAMQQSYSKVSGVLEVLPPVDLVEDALRMSGAALERHQVRVAREFSETPPILGDRHKILQILINLLRNAKYACSESGRADKRVTVRVEPNGGNMVKVSVLDNGIGIPAQNLTRIFNHGFTTRSEGHGYGLHSGALAAKEMGGSLSAHSDGPGKGAAFTLELPLPPPDAPPQS